MKKGMIIAVIILSAVIFAFVAFVLIGGRNNDGIDSLQIESQTETLSDSLETPATGGIRIIQAASTINIYGTLHAGNYDTIVANNSYTNKAFGYTAPSGFNYVQYASPINNHNWSVTVHANREMLSNSAQDGWYYFRGYKSANGDVSQQSGICLDKVKPQIQALINGNHVTNGAITNSSSATITVMGSDNLSGIDTYWYKRDNATTYTQCYSSSSFATSGVYTFYCVDKAGNVSDTVTVTKDYTTPTIAMYTAANASIANGAYVSTASVRFEVSDATSGIEAIYVKLPGASTFTRYPSLSVTRTEEGAYQWYAMDVAGNQSATYSVTVDRTVPNSKIYSGTTLLSSGTNINASSVKFSTDDTTATLYVKKDSGSYAVYANNTLLDAEGTYVFYTKDLAGNQSTEQTVVLDRTAPSGNLYVNGSLHSTDNGKVSANSIYYTGSDKNSFTVYAKLPGSSSFVSVANSTTYTTEGTYTFYCIDKAGNKSAEKTITVDRAAPAVSVQNASGIIVTGNTYDNTEYIAFIVSDTVSGVNGCYVRMPGSTSYVSYTSGTKLYSEGIYYFYAEDSAGNRSATVTITLDKTKPIGSVTASGAAVVTGGYTNKAFRYTATDNLSAVVTFQVKKPGGSWESYTKNTDISGDPGTYYFRSYDGAGNLSDEYSVIYDTAKPIVMSYAGIAAVSSGTFTNAQYVRFTVNDTNLQSCYVKLPGQSSFELTNSGVQFSVAGRYEFYATDLAGNISDTYVVTIDRTAPEGVLYADGKIVTSGTYTNSTFKYTASDGVSGINKIEVKAPDGNWTDYTDGQEFGGDGMANGRYYFRSYDNAGNVSGETNIVFDNIPPEIKMFAGADEKPNNSYTNQEFIKFTASDDNLLYCYIKTPSSDKFVLTTQGIEYTASGTYRFYAEDKAGNESAVYTVILDNINPVGVLRIDGKEVSDGTHTNKAFSYSATDNNGISYLQIKRPNGDWESYTASLVVSGEDGAYNFRACDTAGNISAEMSVVYDTAAPLVTGYAKTSITDSGSFAAAEYITFMAADENLLACYVKQPGSSAFQSTAFGVQYTSSGEYQFYAVDKAGNASAVYTIILDNINPVGTLHIDGNAVSSGTSTNKSFSYNAVDSLSGISGCEIKKPNGTWEAYTPGTVISADSGDGAYSFRCHDEVGNISIESVIYLDTTAPTGTLYADDILIESGSYTNALRIKFVGSSADIASYYVKLPGSSVYELTSSGALYSDTGTYEFYTVDSTGNRSETYTVTIDRTAKSVNITNVNGSITEQNPVISWTNTAGSAPIDSVTVNGVEITSGAIIKTINGGTYTIVCTDAAGNIWTETFTAKRSDIVTTTSNKSWYEAKDSNGKTYSFESYGNAYDFAVLRETALVKTATWNGDVWDTGYIMDSVDSANAKLGTFYIYKKHDDPSTEVAYFTLNRLNEVIAYYASLDIAKVYYWQKTPAESYPGNELYLSSSGGTIISDKLTLRQNLTYMIDGVTLTGTTFSTPGKHILTVCDEYGNSYTIDLIIVSSAPGLQFRTANGDYYSASAAKEYYLKNRITIKLADDLDSYAVAIIKSSKGEVLYILNAGEEYIISEVGKYIITTISHAGAQNYIYYISYESPIATVTENASAKNFNVTVTPSTDKDLDLISVLIYYSEDGNNWTTLTSDDYGTAISTKTLKYNFYKTGYYRVIIEDTCRSGIDAVISEFYYEKSAPVGTLSGVNENGYAGGDVKFTWSDHAYVVLTKDGEVIEYTSGSPLTEEGSYSLVFRDYDNFETVYEFVIDKTAPAITESKEIENGYASPGISFNCDDSGITAVIKKDGVVIGAYENGTMISEDGEYEVVFTDLAGNVTSFAFLIDTVPPVVKLNGVDNGGQTKNKVTITELSEAADLKLYLDGALISYKLGDALSDIGKYKLVITDGNGNISEYEFKILYSFNAASTVFVIILVVCIIGGIALVMILRKKRKFRKSKKTS